MSKIDSASAVVNLKATGTWGRVQLAVAGTILKIATRRGDSALKLIEAAAASMSFGLADLNRSIGRMLDRRRLPLDHRSYGGS